jgi:hypothetical protein
MWWNRWKRLTRSTRGRSMFHLNSLKTSRPMSHYFRHRSIGFLRKLAQPKRRERLM